MAFGLKKSNSGMRHVRYKITPVNEEIVKMLTEAFVQCNLKRFVCEQSTLGVVRNRHYSVPCKYCSDFIIVGDVFHRFEKYVFF